jgi:hypothetical protein
MFAVVRRYRAHEPAVGHTGAAPYDLGRCIASGACISKFDSGFLILSSTYATLMYVGRTSGM